MTRYRLARVALSVLILSSVGCDEQASSERDDTLAVDVVMQDDVATADGQVDQEGQARGPGMPCRTSADCLDGLRCGPPEAPLAGCGEGWTCTDTVQCSAAPPQWWCTCEGVARSLAAGCPGQDAVGVLEIGLGGDVTGERCDPNDLEGFRTDLRVVGGGFEAVRAADEGHVGVGWTAPDGSTSSLGTVINSEGRFEHRDINVVRPDGVGTWVVNVFVDFDNDGVCDIIDGDAIWTYQVRTPRANDLVVMMRATDPTDTEACAAQSMP